MLASGEDASLVHNRYTVDWARMNDEMFANAWRAGRRPIYFMRSAWLHSQPQVMVMWAGDQQTDWSDGDGFPSVIPIGLGLGLAGFPYFGHDIGGYMDQGTTTTSEELFYRWTTLGALSPVMRTHHGRQVDAERAVGVRRRHDRALPPLDAVSHAARRRTSRARSRASSEMACRCSGMIALDYPDEDWAWTTIDEYLLGDRILVAPIVSRGRDVAHREVAGRHVVPAARRRAGERRRDHGDGGDSTEIPAFVPAGSIIVLYPDGVDTMLGAPTTTREVWIYPGTAANPAHAQFGGYAWTGNATSSAMFNGAPVTIANGSVTLSGAGTLLFVDGGALTIPAGAATTIVRLR